MPNYPYSFQLPPLNVQDIPNDGVAGEFLGINGSGQLDWLTAGGGGTGDMLKADNLSGLASYPTARTNLGLGTGDSPTFANLTLTSPSLSSSAPVTISQTWNNAAVAFTGLKVNAAGTSGTNSAAASLLLDLQVGGLRRLTVQKDGWVNIGASDVGSAVRLLDLTNQYGNVGFQVGGGGRLDIMNGGSTVSSFFSGGTMTLTGSGASIGLGTNLALTRDADNTLALRNGANAQTFNVYGTWSSASVYERMFMRYNGTDLAFQVGAETLGATARPLQLWTGGASRLHITTAGNVGIGTTAPSEKLHVLGGKVLFGDATDSTGTAGNGDLTLRAWRAPQLNMVANSASGEPFGLNLKSGTTTLAGINLNVGSGEVKIGGFWTGGYFPTFYSNNVERMRIDTAGNVGIGTTAPTKLLEVALPATGNTLGQGVRLSRGTGYFSLENGSSGAGFLGSFVGKGTVTAAAYALIFEGISGSDADNSNPVLLFTAKNNSGSAVIGNSQTAFQFENYITPLLTIKGSGNVGIGTTSPSSKLHVVGGNILTDNYVQGQRVFSFLGSSTYAGMDTAGMFTNTGVIGFSANTGVNFTNSCDTFLVRDEAYHLSTRNGANGQTFSVYGTYPGAAWERFTITAPTSGNVLLGTYKGTGGIARGLEIQVDGTSRWLFNTSGHLLAAADNTYDIGASGANRPRNVYVGSRISCTDFFLNSNVYLTVPSSGVLLLQNGGASDFNRLQLGGTTDAFPAIARDGAGIKFTGAAAGSTAWIKVPPVAVGSLPVAATAGAGARAFVNDASAPVFGTAVAGGGAVLVPVYCTGSAWNVG